MKKNGRYWELKCFFATGWVVALGLGFITCLTTLAFFEVFRTSIEWLAIRGGLISSASGWLFGYITIALFIWAFPTIFQFHERIQDSFFEKTLKGEGVLK